MRYDELWSPPANYLKGTATLRSSTARYVPIEASGEDPEAVLWELIKQGIAMLAESKRTVPYNIKSPQAEVEIATDHYSITIKWSRDSKPRQQQYDVYTAPNCDDGD